MKRNMTTSSAWAAGDVVVMDFPYADGAVGKNRPALVLTAPSPHGDYTVAMISTSQDEGVSITAADFSTGSLKQDSFVRVRHVYTCESKCFVTKRGALKPDAMKRVMAALCPALGCKSWGSSA